jgi:hypothetical protein
MSNLITPSLLNSWAYCVHSGVVGDFLKVLNREPTEKTEAMAKGDEFEKWAIANIDELKGGAYQCTASKQLGDYVLYGRVDVLKAGIVYDVKYTANYDVGKYYGNYQTPIYLEMIPEARKMVYIIGNKDVQDYEEGNAYIYREEYTRDDCRPVSVILREFEQWLTVCGFMNIYKEKWRSLY